MSEETKRKSVGLVVMTKISEDEGVVAVLCRRGKRDHEKKWAKQSRSGTCQVSVHGKVKEGETFIDALYRETEEEFGLDFCRALKTHEIETLINLDEDASSLVTYGVFVLPEAINLIRLECSSGGLEFVKENHINSIINLSGTDKGFCITNLSVVAMFSDEIDALKAAFLKWGN